MEKISFVLEKNDLIAAGKEIWRIPFFRKQYDWMIITPVVLALVFIAFLFIPASPQVYKIIDNVCIFGVVFFLYIDVVVYFTTGRGMYKVLKGTDMERTVSLQEDGIYSENSTSNGLLKWGGFLHVAQGKKTIFLFIGKRLTYLIPKRAFKSEEEMNCFYNTVYTNVEKTKEVLK